MEENMEEQTNQPQTPGGEEKKFETNKTGLAALAHALGIITGFVGALIIYLVAEDEFSKDQAKEALNFQITITIAYIVGGILTMVFIGILVMWAAGIISLIFSIIGAVTANKGEKYRYPFAIRLIK
jgi:hypothetical protein